MPHNFRHSHTNFHGFLKKNSARYLARRLTFKERLGCRRLSCMFLILSVIVFAGFAMLVHELGHLVAARLCNVPASELGLGMGRRIATFRVASIKLSFGLLP